MPRYLIQGKLPDPSDFPFGPHTRECLSDFVSRSTEKGADWVLSFMSQDEAYCICDAPSLETMRNIAMSSRYPVDKITEVKILDPATHD